MSDLIQDFIDDMHRNGCAPFSSSEIKPDNKRHNFRLADDPPKKKRGYYKLKIEGDFAFGFYGDYRMGEVFKWHSKTNKKYTPEEIAAFKEKVERDRRESEAEEKRLHDLRAQEVQEFLLFMSEAENHPYLDKKKINPCGIYISGKYLIIPMESEGKLWNYQRIDRDGDKAFYKEARVSGTYYKIEGSEDTVYICEGFATGASIHEATGSAVYVAFNAGNLGHVAALIKQKYDNLIVAADNDHETIINKKPYNTGIEKAKQVCADHGLCYVYPEFKDGRGLSDFNDLIISEGKDAVLKCLQGARSVKAGGDSDSSSLSLSATPPAPSDSWQDQLIQGKHGLIPTSTINATLVTQNDEGLRGVFCYDSFSKRVLLRSCPPWDDEKNFRVRPVQDHDYLPLECYLESKWNLRVGKNKCADLIEAVSREKENTINPAADYFNALEWDGVDRLDTWLQQYVSDGNQPADYLKIVGVKFMCGLAARAMKPGIKFDTMIIFEGEQYAGKSFLSKIMATVNGEEYFLDDFKDIENKDALMKMQGKLVIEFPEIGTLRKAEVNDLKAFISRQEDEFRPPYGRNTIVAPRQCVFVGTVNPEGPYLRDITGNRRYWPVSCRKKMPIDELKEVMPHLHAEAAQRVKNGETLWLNDDEYELAKNEQQKRVMEDLWTDKIESFITHLTEVSTDEICLELGISADKKSPLVHSRINQIMTGLGWVNARIPRGNKRIRGFKNLNYIEGAKQEEISW